VSRIGCLRTALFIAIIAPAAFFGPEAVTRSQLNRLDAAARTSAVDLPPVPRPPMSNRISDFGESDAVLDLYGNEVMPAVATYTFDDLGSLYEVHSPQTEVPRLGSPKS